MQWLNSLDNAVDRVLINNNEQDENDESVMMDESISDVDPWNDDDESSINSTQRQSNTTLSREEHVDVTSTLDENDDFVAATRQGEQAAGQDSTSCTMATLPQIEPGTSLLMQEEEKDELPTSEPSGPTRELRGSIYHESHSRRASVQEPENRGSINHDSHERRKSALQQPESPNHDSSPADAPHFDSEDENDVPAQVGGDENDEFQVSLPLPSWDSDIPLDPWLNCYGVVHVRLICAQRLPCPVGSSVQGIVALPPWKGRVKSEKTSAFLGPNGVSVRWDQLQDAGYCTMVNSWNSLDNPTPSIFINIVFHPLQMVEFSMCTVTLSCAPIMMEPGKWKKQWCQTILSQKINDSDGYLEAEERVPLILLEAMFVPAGTVDDNEGDESTEIEDEASVEAPSSTGASASPSTFRSRKTGGASVGTGGSYILSQRNKSHLLRVQSLWVPAACAVCNSIIVGWKSAYRCEACNIDCCKDCQLQVDLQMPCGSSEAAASVAASFHNKLTIQNIMNVMAPWDASMEKKESIHESSLISKSTSVHPSDANGAAERNLRDMGGVGTLRVHISRAHVFEKILHPETAPNDVFRETTVKRGDYYIRLTSNEPEPQSRRTRTTQNSGVPHFDSEELEFNVSNYGVEYRIDLVDAASDKPIGMAVLTTQGLLQQQRDAMVATDGFAVINPFQRPSCYTEKRRWRLELRTGIKNEDYFKSTKGRKKGAITGWVDVDLCLTEATDQLYSSRPLECPPRPPDGLDVERFQAHLARIGAILGDIKKSAETFSYVISWKNPALTSLSLMAFVGLCLKFNAEYIASLPVFCLIVHMTFLATARKAGRLKERFIDRETKTCLESEKKVAVKYSTFRPIGRLNISVQRGRNIRSRDLGLPGSAGCRIYWDPLRYCHNEKTKASIIAIDSSMSTSHDIGSSSFQYSATPSWDRLYESEETKRLQQLIPNQGEFFASQTETRAGTESSLSKMNERSSAVCVFPILHPLKVSKQRHDSSHDELSGEKTVVELDTWESTPSAIVVEVRFQDVLNKLPGFDDVLGEISLPLSQLIKIGEIRGWFRVVDPGASPSAIDNSSTDTEIESGHPEVYLEVRWIPPELSDENLDAEREASVVLAEELIRSASQAKAGVDLMGTSIGAFNTVSGLSGHVHMIQNTLGSALDTVESIRNAFNFSDPYKSSILFCALVLLWLFLAIVPLRLLILLGGLGLYASTFQMAFFPSSRSSSKTQTTLNLETGDSLERRMEKQESPVGIWIKNAIRGLPTDEDLRKAYFWESRRVGEQARATLAEQKRKARLQKLWKAVWYSNVQLKTPKASSSSALDRRGWQWEDAFAIVQGRRFLWWPSARDFDSGEAPVGRIFLAGHAGLAGLSPLEMRELDKNETPLVVSIFGRGLKEQQRITILTESVASKEALEMAVHEASTKAD